MLRVATASDFFRRVLVEDSRPKLDLSLSGRGVDPVWLQTLKQYEMIEQEVK